MLMSLLLIGKVLCEQGKLITHRRLTEKGIYMTSSIAIQILPEAADDNQLCDRVDKVIDYIKSTGLKYEVGPFETTIEGEDIDRLMDIAKDCLHIAIEAGASKVSSYIKVVYKPEGEILSIDRKIGKYR